MFAGHLLVGQHSERGAEMPKVLSKVQIEQFHSEGFLSPVPVLSPEEVEKYKGHLEAFEARYPDHRRKLKSKSHCSALGSMRLHARPTSLTSMRT